MFVHDAENLLRDVESQEEDYGRRTMKWDTKIETRMREAEEQAKKSAKGHHEKAIYQRRSHRVVIGISIALPMLATIVGAYRARITPTCEVDVYTVMLTALTTLLNSTRGALKFELQCREHFFYSAKWKDFATTISYELSKPREHRDDAAVMIARVKTTEDCLRDNEPA
jgi:hypothetical protein